MAESYISELGDKLSHGVANTDGSRVKIIAPKLYTDGNSHPSIATALAKKLDKTTYEWNKEIAFGSSGKLCIGKFPMYDSNITITISSTTSTSYYGVIVIATQNINTSRGGSYTVSVYGDPSGYVATNLKVKYSSGSRNFEVYFSPGSWTKNLVHIQANALQAAPTDVCTTVDTLPTTDLVDVVNSLDSKVNVKNTSLAGQTTTLLAEVKALGVAGIHYARFYTESDSGSANISDKPVGVNAAFVCEVICNKRATASDYFYQLNCWVRTDPIPYVAYVGPSVSSITWKRPSDDSAVVHKSGDSMTGKLEMAKPITQVIKGTGVAATSSTSGSTTTYYPAKWNFDLGIATPTAGDRMVIQIPVAGSDYGEYISTDNGTTYFPVARSTGTSRLTTHYPVLAYIMVIFEAYENNTGCGRVNDIFPLAGGTSRVSKTDGCWRVINDYDSGNNYERLYTGSYCYAGSTGINPYSMVALDSDGKYSMFISSGSGTGTGKTVNTTTKFAYPPNVLYYSANNTNAANTRTASNSFFEALAGVDLRYSCNYTTAFTGWTPLFIECTRNSDGTWTPTANSFTQTLREGYYYVYLGEVNSGYTLYLQPVNMMYYYDGSKLVSVDSKLVTSSSTNGKVSVLGSDVTVYTHPTQTAQSAKGSATKVPQITTDSTGHVTGITEVTITGVTPASHTHGNIANGGTLTDTAAAAAGNDYVVIRDADNAKIQTSTIKGTDVADAVSKKHSHSTLTLSTTAQAYDGSHTLALPSTDPYTSARTPTSHTHGNITNAGAIGSTSGYAVYTTTNGVLTAGTLATSDPSADGNSLSFIATISQDAKGKITATKKSVTIDTALSSTSTNPVQNKVINTALAGKQNTLTEMTEAEVDDLLAVLT